MKVPGIALFLLLITSTLWAGDGLDAAASAGHAGRLDSAIASLEEALNAQPERPELYEALAFALIRAERFAAAEELLHRGIALAPKRAALYLHLATLLDRRGEMTEARAAAAEAIRLNPDDAEAARLLQRLDAEADLAGRMIRTPTGTFALSFEDGGESLGDAVREILEQAYVDLGSRFQLWPDTSIEVILYGDRDYRRITGAPEWSGGLYDGKIRIPAGGINAGDPELRRIIRHEYAHLLIRRLARNRVPLWLNEGLAQYFEPEPPTITELEMRIAGSGEPIPLPEAGDSFSRLNRDEARLAYQQSYALTRYLIETYGEDRVLELLPALGRGSSFAEAAADSFGVSDGQAGSLLRAWVESLHP